MMTGGGSCYNGANRWFDKTVQLVVSEDGSSGLCYEHSCSEGIVVISLLETIVGRQEMQTIHWRCFHNHGEGPVESFYKHFHI